MRLNGLDAATHGVPRRRHQAPWPMRQRHQVAGESGLVWDQMRAGRPEGIALSPFRSHSARVAPGADAVRAARQEPLDVNEQSMQGHTPLHMCAANGHVEVMQFVLNQKGCDANIQTKLGNTAVHLAGLPARGPSSTG